MRAETFGERLRRLREAAELSPGSLAAKVGVTEGAIRQMESGQTKSASFSVGVRLADALSVTPHFLATGSEMRVRGPEGIDVSTAGGVLSIAVRRGSVVYGGTEKEFLDSLQRKIQGTFSALVTPPAASADATHRATLAFRDPWQAIEDLQEAVAALQEQAKKAEATHAPGESPLRRGSRPPRSA